MTRTRRFLVFYAPGATMLFATALAYVLPGRDEYLLPFGTAGLFGLVFGTVLSSMWREPTEKEEP